MQKPALFGGKLIKVEHLRQYVRTIGRQDEATREGLERALISPAALRVVINYIHEELVDEKYQSKRQRRRLVHTTSVKERVNIVQCTFTNESARPIDGPIIFPPVDFYRVNLPHEDALVLTLGIGEFDVCKILVNSGSSTSDLQISAYRQMGYSSFTLENQVRILFGFNGATTISLGVVVLPIQASPTTLNLHFSIINDLLSYNAIMG